MSGRPGTGILAICVLSWRFRCRRAIFTELRAERVPFGGEPRTALLTSALCAGLLEMIQPSRGRGNSADDDRHRVGDGIPGADNGAERDGAAVVLGQRERVPLVPGSVRRRRCQVPDHWYRPCALSSCSRAQAGRAPPSSPTETVRRNVCRVFATRGPESWVFDFAKAGVAAPNTATAVTVAAPAETSAVLGLAGISSPVRVDLPVISQLFHRTGCMRRRVGCRLKLSFGCRDRSPQACSPWDAFELIASHLCFTPRLEVYVGMPGVPPVAGKAGIWQRGPLRPAHHAAA